MSTVFRTARSGSDELFVFLGAVLPTARDLINFFKLSSRDAPALVPEVSATVAAACIHRSPAHLFFSDSEQTFFITSRQQG